MNSRLRSIGIMLLCMLALSCSGGADPESSPDPVTPVQPSRDPVQPSSDPVSSDPSSQPGPSESGEGEDYEDVIAAFDRDLSAVQGIVEMYDRDVPLSYVEYEDDVYTLVFGGTSFDIVCDVNERGAPNIGVTSDAGNYYWTAEGEIISTKVSVLSGKPSLKVEGGKWHISIGGEWKELGEAAPAGELYSIVLFSSVRETASSVTLTFADGNHITLAKEGHEDESEDPTEPFATVSTGTYAYLTTTGVTLYASFSGATGVPTSAGFEWGLSSSSLTEELYVDRTFTSTSDSFSASLSSLDPGTTYYYRAFVILDNSRYFYGTVRSFTTLTPAPTIEVGQYLGCYEMPSMNLSGSVETGNESFGNTKYYSYGTTSSKQLVVTHTFKETGGRQRRNYTVLFDGDKHCPIWSAFVMHDDIYPDNNAGRSNSWTYDPAVPASWQQKGLDNANKVGYSRGHHVASSYRQCTSEANKQTFYYTNQSPQWQTRFNDGVWNNMENAIIGRAPSGRDTLYVTVGVLFETSKTLPSDGVQVSVPSHFYTCLMLISFDSSGNMTAAKGEAYLFENKEYSSGASYYDYRTSIKAVESRAGLNMFANVPANLQASAEAMTSGVL